MKKAMKGTLAVSTMGASVAAEKAIKAGSAGLSAQGEAVTNKQQAAGVLWFGMSHEAGRNAKITLYADRIEREKPRSRVSVQKAVQDHEVIPIRSVTSVNIRKNGALFSEVTVLSAGGSIPFRFRHADAQALRSTIMPLVLKAGQPTVLVHQAEPQLDVADQIKKLADLRDQGILSADEFDAKKAQLLSL